MYEEIKLFEQNQIRSVWDDEKEQWFFSVTDVVKILTDSKDPASYIKKLRQRDKELSKGWGQIVTPLVMSTNGGPQNKAINHILPKDELPFNNE